jgi:hypothetical protein
MKNRVLTTFASLALLSGAAAFAQSGTLMHANIPFEFRVGTTVLPPGDYNVRPAMLTGVLSIRCFGCKASAMIQTAQIGGSKMQETGKLVFHRYGSTYFLSEVWTPGYSTGRVLPKTKGERELARNSSPAGNAQITLARR